MRNTKPAIIIWAGLATVIIFASGSPCIAQSTTAVQTQIRTVALSGDPAPGLPGGIAFGKRNAFVSPRVDGNGRVCFVSSLSGKKLIDRYAQDRFGNDTAFFIEEASGIQLVARSGDSIGGLEKYKTEAFANYCMGGDGKVIIKIRMSDKPRGDSHFVVLANDSGKFDVVGRTGAAAIGDPRNKKLGDLNLNNERVAKGGLSFSGSIAEPDRKLRARQGIWFGATGSLESVVAGQKASAMGPDYVFVGFDGHSLSTDGNLAFSATCSNQPEEKWGYSPVFSIWFRNQANGKLQLVAKKGDAAPGPDGHPFRGFGAINLGRNGHLVFRARHQGKRGPNTNGVYSSFYHYQDGNLKQIARDGGPIPDDESQNAFFILNSAIVNETGRIAYEGSWKEEGEGATELGLFADVSGEMKRLARTNAPVTTAAKDVTYKKFLNYDFLTPTQIVVCATTSEKSKVIAVSKAGAPLVPVIQPGMKVEVRPGDERTIKQIQYGGLATKHATEGGIAGYVAFQANFEDRTSGVLVAAIPAE